MAQPMGLLPYTKKVAFTSPFIKVPVPTASFADQVVIITGSNVGVGLETARHVTRLGAAKVHLAVRDVAKGEDAAADIAASTKVTKNVIEVWSLDVTSHESILDFAKRVNEFDRLDAVLENAGVTGTAFHRTPAGDERIFGTNTLGTILLGLLLLPKLRESASKFNTRNRLVFTGSESYLIARLSEAEAPGLMLRTLNEEDVFHKRPTDRYMNSKLLLMYAMREMAARSPVSAASNVVITSVTPGLCWTTLWRELAWYIYPIYLFFMTLLARTPEVGSRLLVNSIKPDLNPNVHGAFLWDDEMSDLGPSIESEKGQQLSKRFTTELFDHLETVSPGVTAVLDP